MQMTLADGRQIGRNNIFWPPELADWDLWGIEPDMSTIDLSGSDRPREV
jgi:hypothetical protein